MSDSTDRMAADVSEILLDTSAFAEEATFSFGDVEKVVSVIFDENYMGIDQFGTEVANAGPMAMAATAEVENEDHKIPGENDDEATLIVRETTYYVIKAARNGDVTNLYLSKERAE